MAMRWNELYCICVLAKGKYVYCDVLLEGVAPKDAIGLSKHAKKVWEKKKNEEGSDGDDDDDEGKMNNFVSGMPAHEKAKAGRLRMAPGLPDGVARSIHALTVPGQAQDPHFFNN